MLVITSPCIDIKDGICTTCCPVDCIYEGERMFYIHPGECIECGLCESICPVDAIRYDDELPAAEADFLRLNDLAFRRPDGSLMDLGGWHKRMPPLPDPEEVREMPRKEKTP